MATIVDLLSFLKSQWIVCELARSAFCDILHTMSRVVTVTVARAEVDMKQGVRAVRLGDRKFRIEEAMKDFVAVGVVRKKRCHSGAQFRRVTGADDDSTARKWEAAYLAKYNTAMHQQLPLTGCVHLADDAARNGMPMEETSMYVIFDADVQRGGLLMPQVTYA